MAHAFGPLYTVIRYKTDRGGEPDRRGSSVSLSLYGACTPYGGGCPVRTPMPAKGPSDGATVECQLSI